MGHNLDPDSQRMLIKSTEHFAPVRVLVLGCGAHVAMAITIITGDNAFLT